MELLGSNAAFGSERVNVSSRRYVLPIDERDRPFPFGAGGLLPVVTVRKNGVERVIFAFPRGEAWPDDDRDGAGASAEAVVDEQASVAGETPETPEAAEASEAQGAPEAPETSEPSEALETSEASGADVPPEPSGPSETLEAPESSEPLAPTSSPDATTDAPAASGDATAPAEPGDGAVPDAPADEPTPADAETPPDAPASAEVPRDDPWGRSPELDELYDAVCLVNDLLDHAARLSGHAFGFVDGIQMGVPGSGRGFTHVELVPYDEYGDPNPFPVRLHIETSTEPSSPDSLSVVLDYDEQGYPSRALMTEYGRGGRSCRVISSYNAKANQLVIRKVEESSSSDRHGRLVGRTIYERGRRAEDLGEERDAPRAHRGGWGYEDEDRRR